MNAPTCPECGAPMVLRRSRASGRPFFGCSTAPRSGCPGYHSANADGTPMGIPGDLATRAARIRAHEALDGLVQDGLLKSRPAAYRWMRERMGLSKSAAHIGRFSVAECERLIAAVQDFEEERAAPSHRRRRAS